jgi:signal transduction histidine kinase
MEVSRLRLELREALHDVEASRTWLVEAAAEERRSLERDLHDGAQQQIVSDRHAATVDAAQACAGLRRASGA